MYLYDRDVATITNLKYANSLSNYYVIMMLPNLKKLQNREFSRFFHISETRRDAT